MSQRLLLPILVIATVLVACGQTQQTSAPTDATKATSTFTEQGQLTPTASTLAPIITEQNPPTLTSEVPEIKVSSDLVTRAKFAVALAFAPDGRLFYNEFQTGDIRIFVDGQTSIFVHVDIFLLGECGLLGLVLDPDFNENHYVYIYFIEPVGSRDDIGHPVIMRFTDIAGKGEDPTVIVGDLPNTNPIICGHVSGNLNFGADGYLYFSVGEMEFKTPAQDLSSPLGKIHRIDPRDGSAPPDNPFVNEPGADPRVFAYGVRNTFEFTFHPQSGRIYAPENGLGNCDELNIIEAGKNYGHPESSFVEEDPPCMERAGVRPIYLFSRPDMRPETFTSNVAPTGVVFVSADIYPSLGDALLVCEWNTGFMRRLLLVGPGQDQVLDDGIVVEDCQLDVTVDPNGIVYYSNPGEIRHLVPSSNP